MSTAVKISEEKAELLRRWKDKLRERDVKVTQKELMENAILLGIRRQEEMLEMLNSGKKSKEETTKKFFEGGERYDFGDDWLEEIDTTL